MKCGRLGFEPGFGKERAESGSREGIPGTRGVRGKNELYYDILIGAHEGRGAALDWTAE